MCERYSAPADPLDTFNHGKPLEVYSGILLSLVALSVLVTVLDWRKGILLLVLVGAVQDPIRKLTPDAPGYLVLATAPIWLTICVLALSSGYPSLLQFKRFYRPLAWAIVLFLASLLPAALVSATYGPGSWKLAVIGLFSYGSVICGLLVGFRYTRRLNDLRRVLGFYCIVTATMLLGTPLDYFGLWPDWRALGTTALGMQWVRFRTGYAVELTAGFYRSPDIMGWHAIAVGMLASTLAVSSEGAKRCFWISIAAWGVFAAALSGRRKIVMMIPVFALVLAWLYWRSRNPGRLVTVIGVLLGVLVLALFVYQSVGPDAEIGRYYLTPFGEVVDRVRGHGYQALITTFQQSGFFGEGLGSASLGAQHLQVARPRTWQEGGLGKSLVELGVPGFICFMILSFLVLKSIFRLPLRRFDPGCPAFALMAGLTAFFLANVGSFVISHQAFGDPFISSFFSLVIGFLMSAARYRPSQVRIASSLRPNRTRSLQFRRVS